MRKYFSLLFILPSMFMFFSGCERLEDNSSEEETTLSLEEKERAKEVAMAYRSWKKLSFAEQKSQRLEKILAQTGASILHKPVAKNISNPIIKLSSGVCFDISKLPAPWYLAESSSRHLKNAFTNYRSFPPESSFFLAVSSDVINIPYYDVIVPTDVTYGFVTPGQNYLTVMVVSGSENTVRNFTRKVNKESYKPRKDRTVGYLDVELYSDLKLFPVDGWNFKIFQSISCRHCDEGPFYGSPFHIVDFERNAYASPDVAKRHWKQNNYNSSRRPVDGWFEAPKLAGQYLHESKLFSVDFLSSSRATLHTPVIFNEIDKVLGDIQVNCED